MALDLSDNDITDAGGEVLASSLAHNSSLKRLYLCDNKIGDGSGFYLQKVMKENKTLGVLDLSGNYIKVSVVEMIQ